MIIIILICMFWFGLVIVSFLNSYGLRKEAEERYEKGLTWYVIRRDISGKASLELITNNYKEAARIRSKIQRKGNECIILTDEDKNFYTNSRAAYIDPMDWVVMANLFKQ